VAQGTVLAYVIPNAVIPDATASMTVRVALEPEQAAMLRSQSPAVSVRLAHFDALPATWLRDPTRDSTATVTQLPSAALGDRYGGDIVTAPADSAGRKSDSTAARPVVLMDVQVAHAPVLNAQQIGARAWVRFDQGSQPLAWTLARRAQQAVLMHFSPSS
jgi:putative peptide zinc metalloprotease protein